MNQSKLWFKLKSVTHANKRQTPILGGWNMVKPTFPDILPGVDSQQFSQPSVVPGRSHELLLTDLTVTGKVHQTKTIVIEAVDGEMFGASKYLNKFSISSGTTSFFPFSFRESGGSWPRATRVLTISFLDITLFPTLPKILILTWQGRIEIFPVVESERSQPFLLPRELRVDRVEEDEDVLELHVVVLVPVQQPEQLLHQLPLRFTGQGLDEGGELLEVQFSITRPELLLLLSCIVIRYLESVLQKFQHIWTVSSLRSVWSPAKLRYQLGTSWNSLVSAWPINNNWCTSIPSTPVHRWQGSVNKVYWLVTSVTPRSS